MRAIDGNLHDILAGRDQDFINLRRADGPHIVNRAGLIGAVKKLRRAIRIAIQRLILQVGEIYGTEPEMVLFSQVTSTPTVSFRWS